MNKLCLAGIGIPALLASGLALAAATLLPALAAVGFVSGAGNSPASLDTLALLYAGLPCALKALALIMLTFFLPDEE